MEKLKMHSPNLTQDNIARILECFPGCVTEARREDGSVRLAVDFDQLRQELAESIVEGPQERYQLNWVGKREALLNANAPIAKTLRPCREESVDFDSTENLYIEGDNLDALKLLQETYLNKVKMIYIDPPYNTGNDFIYDDDFAENTADYLQRSNQKDESGNRLTANPESNGRFHSDWLSMMYPRLKLARNLLRDDGVIFISIDDNEQANLKRLCDEVFGEDNFVANVIRRSKIGGGSDNKQFALEADFIACYAKSKNFLNVFYAQRNENDLKRYRENDEKGRFFWDTYSRSGLAKGTEESLYYEVIFPDGSKKSDRWRRSKERLVKDIEEGEAKFVTTSNGWNVHFKQRLSEDGKRPRQIMYDGYGNSNGTENISDIFKNKYVFEYPKPLNLVHFLVQIVGEQTGIILDFFSGSATTAHAVMQLNAEDGGKRKFIMVQIPEACDEKSEAFKAGYKTIADIGKERIRRAGQKIKQENADKSGIDQLDIGFRVLKVDSSNMNPVFYAPDQISQGDLHEFAENIRADRDEEDLLFQVLLDWGVDLSLPITRETIADKSVLFVDDNALAACFENEGGITEDFVKQLAARQPLRVVFRDAGFASDSVKINVEQIFKLLSPSTDIKTL